MSEKEVLMGCAITFAISSVLMSVLGVVFSKLNLIYGGFFYCSIGLFCIIHLSVVKKKESYEK